MRLWSGGVKVEGTLWHLLARRPSGCAPTEQEAAVASAFRGMRWDEAQDALVRASYPDYGLMARHLPHRSLPALKKRVTALGIVRRRHVWKQTEVRKLTRLVAADASNAELSRAFPEFRLTQIASKIRHLKLPRRKPNLVAFDDAAIHEVRRRAVAKNMTLVELDHQARTGRYFQKSTRRLVLEHVARATVVLDGEILIEWEAV